MKLQILSDLHFEFHKDKGRSFVDALDPTDIDILIIAGDLSSLYSLLDALELFCNRFKQVIFVAGNHEYYGSSPKDIEAARNFVKRDNLYWLDNNTVTIDDVIFAGTTLWFPESPEAIRNQRCLSDFDQITNFIPWVYEQNQLASKFLLDTMKKDVVVITHHLPSEKSIHQRYKNSPLNAFFLCDIELLIKERQPKLCIHGHTHSSSDYKIDETRVICNPYGYQGFEINERFNPKLIVEV